MSGKVEHRSGGHHAPPPHPVLADGPVNEKAAQDLAAALSAKIKSCFFLFQQDPSSPDFNFHYPNSFRINVDGVTIDRQSPKLLVLSIKMDIAYLTPSQKSAVTIKIRKEVAQVLQHAEIVPNYAKLIFPGR